MKISFRNTTASLLESVVQLEKTSFEGRWSPVFLVVFYRKSLWFSLKTSADDLKCDLAISLVMRVPRNISLLIFI